MNDITAQPLQPGACIGIIGGGQLGRMLCVAAARLGFKTHIFDPSQTPPAADVAAKIITGDYNDAASLAAFVADVDVVTFEFENIPASSLSALAERSCLRPGINALRVSQDRLTEKDFLTELGLRTAPYAPVATQEELRAATDQIGMPSILKTRRLGYDGKGQLRIKTPEDLEEAQEILESGDAILEGFISFSTEISVIVSRSIDGQVVCFDPGENRHEDGILRSTTTPAKIPASIAMDAVLAAGKIANALDYVGVMGVEFFVTPHGLIVNEIAPRVHNSGHWTQNGCAIDQFEQHIRAIVNWPLGDGARHSDVVMENLIGEDMARLDTLRADPENSLHLYGKSETRPGRKMGHFNRVIAKNTAKEASL